ncbi:MAG: hypothetical protein DRH93_15595 [Deltaproteobacteria bacterium]|nr:MAG: hypothetical protein DRH93_15595 [Deltaproteobacteria bacterium]
MEEKQIAVREPSLLLDVERFEHAQRVAKMLSQSTMVPDHFRENIGNCVIALNYAARAGVDPFMVMQKMYIIHGKPAVEAQLQIALFNNSPRFSALKFKVSGTGDNLACVAYATERETGEVIEGVTISIAMAKKEGWFQKKGSKWQSLPELMLRYRAAAFFIRVNSPETTLGLQTKEELQEMDFIDVTPNKKVEQEIEENANTEAIDIPAMEGEVVDAEMSEEEKAAILQDEKEQAQTDKKSNADPGF